MTRAQKLLRRRLIAEQARAGERTGTLMARFNVCNWTVHATCREFGMDISGRRRGMGRKMVERSMT